MATGHKTGGRTAGTPNKKTREITELLHSLDCNPIEGMILIAQDPNNSMELRGRMYSEVAKYVYPQRNISGGRTGACSFHSFVAEA